MLTAFVAGATGYTGREVVRQLVLRKVRALAHVRPDSPRLEEWKTRFAEMGAEVDATPWDAAAMAATLAKVGPDVVFSLLGTTRKRGAEAARAGREETYESVDFGLTALLLEAARTTPSRPRFIYLSSAGVNGTTTNRYLAVRWRAEELLRKSGLSFAIARPSFITGSDRDESRPGERVGSTIADGALGILGALGATQLRDRYRSTSNETLAAALVRLALDEKTSRVAESEDLR